MRTILLAIAAAALPGIASAQLVEEVRVGALAHNICVTDCKNADKEDGPNVEGELVFASPGIFDILLSPRPFLVGSANVAGNTSYAGGGLMWNFEFADGWAIEPSLGYVLHDGELESPFPQGDPRSEAFASEHVFLGSRDLFRTGLALNKDFGENWGGQLLFEHLSHGQILGEGRNQGMDSAGVRIYYRFGG
ncbi:MAG: acyloxyacyl hydrolase [Hyphomonadaceae bacterium]|nr:acyloxyacyl hydrolase [Hyphomonadaceae bacterium]